MAWSLLREKDEVSSSVKWSLWQTATAENGTELQLKNQRRIHNGINQKDFFPHSVQRGVCGGKEPVI